MAGACATELLYRINNNIYLAAIGFSPGGSGF
jgi:hypothetical protein